MAYRFRAQEVAQMKNSIIVHCNTEREPDKYGNKSAWRLRCVLEGLYMCCPCSKKERSRRFRRLALYEKLTKNDMPAF